MGSCSTLTSPRDGARGPRTHHDEEGAAIRRQGSVRCVRRACWSRPSRSVPCAVRPSPQRSGTPAASALSARGTPSIGGCPKPPRQGVTARTLRRLPCPSCVLRSRGHTPATDHERSLSGILVSASAARGRPGARATAVVMQAERRNNAPHRSRMTEPSGLTAASSHADVRPGLRRAVGGRRSASTRHRGRFAHRVRAARTARRIRRANAGALTFIATDRGRACREESFGTWFGDVCQEARCPGSAHGPREAGDGAAEAQLSALYEWEPGECGLPAARPAGREGLRGTHKSRTVASGAGESLETTTRTTA